MKFMVEFSVKSGDKNKVLQTFEQRGPNRDPGVTWKAAWIGKSTNVGFALVESADETLVAKAATSWMELDDVQVAPVMDVEQF